MKAKESTASIQRSGPEELKAALREKIKESTNQGRGLSEEESIQIRTEIARIQALEKEIATGGT